MNAVCLARVWPQIPNELAEHIADCLSPNEVACSLRLLSKAAAALFRRPKYTKIILSQTCPHHAFAHTWGSQDAFRRMSCSQRRKLLCLTAASGSIPNLALAASVIGLTLTAQELCVAAAAGQLDSCRWLLERGCPVPDFSSDPLSAAAEAGHHHICDWLIANGATCSAAAACAAARGGHTRLMAQLLARRPGWQYNAGRVAQALTAAAHGCDLPTLQCLYKEWLDCDDGEEGKQQRWWQRRRWRLGGSDAIRLLAAAAGSPTPDWAAKLEWLEEELVPTSAGTGGAAAMRAVTATVTAAAAGRPDGADRVSHLLSRGYPADAATVAAAAGSGNLPLLHLLLTREGVAVSEAEVTAAAEGGHLAALQALHAAGAPVCRPSALRAAAAAGHLPVVVWLADALGIVGVGVGAGQEGQDGGGAVSGGGAARTAAVRVAAEAAAVRVATEATEAAAMSAAAESGVLDVVLELAARGCGVYAGAWGAAAGGGCEAALEWLAERGCPMPDDGEPYLRAAQNGDLATLRTLRRLGCPWGRAATQHPGNAAGAADSAATAAADVFAAGCAPAPGGGGDGGGTFARCAGRCSLPVLHWLLGAGCPVEWGDALAMAQWRWPEQDRQEAVCWLEAQRELARLQRTQ